jgi:dUTP pyrophosphatase
VIGIMREDWADPAVALPSYATPGAAGADLRANLPPGERATGLVLVPGARALVATGLRMEIPPGWEAQIRPRSGLALNHGVTVLNSPGTIDSDYRGPVGVVLVNLGAEAFTVVHGARIAQMIVAPAVQVRMAPVPALGGTARGVGGFGSTGQD